MCVCLWARVRRWMSVCRDEWEEWVSGRDTSVCVCIVSPAADKSGIVVGMVVVVVVMMLPSTVSHSYCPFIDQFPYSPGLATHLILTSVYISLYGKCKCNCTWKSWKGELGREKMPYDFKTLYQDGQPVEIPWTENLATTRLLPTCDLDFLICILRGHSNKLEMEGMGCCAINRSIRMIEQPPL